MQQNLIIKENIPLRGLNTFHIDATARYFIEVNNYEQLTELIESGFVDKNPVLLLGGGSNLLFTNNFKGIVVQIRNKGIEIFENAGNTVWVKAAAGENWHEFVTYCVEKDLVGLKIFP